MFRTLLPLISLLALSALSACEPPDPTVIAEGLIPVESGLYRLDFGFVSTMDCADIPEAGLRELRGLDGWSVMLDLEVDGPDLYGEMEGGIEMVGVREMNGYVLESQRAVAVAVDEEDEPAIRPEDDDEPDQALPGDEDEPQEDPGSRLVFHGNAVSIDELVGQLVIDMGGCDVLVETVMYRVGDEGRGDRPARPGEDVDYVED